MKMSDERMWNDLTTQEKNERWKKMCDEYELSVKEAEAIAEEIALEDARERDWERKNNKPRSEGI